jgi:hypothetical protein
VCGRVGCRSGGPGALRGGRGVLVVLLTGRGFRPRARGLS